MKIRSVFFLSFILFFHLVTQGQIVITSFSSLDSLLVKDSSVLDFIPCSVNATTFAPINKPCFLKIEKNDFDLRLHEQMKLLQYLADTLCDWNAYLMLEWFYHEKEGSQSFVLYNQNEIGKWRNEQKWRDLELWLVNLGFLEKSVDGYNNPILLLEDRLMIFNEVLTDKNNYLVISQMKAKIKILRELHQSWENKEKNRNKLLKLVEIIKYYDELLCNELELPTQSYKYIYMFYFKESAKGIYSDDLWLRYFINGDNKIKPKKIN